jgi:hypothetical protein
VSDIIPLGEEPPPMEEQPKGRRARGRKGTGRKQITGRFRTINSFVDFTMRDLSRAEALVWLILWRDTRDGLARTSQADLARRAGVDERTARRAITRLGKMGLLTCAYRGGLSRGPSTYRVDPAPVNRTPVPG